MVENIHRKVGGPKPIGLGDGPASKCVRHLVALSIHPQDRQVFMLIENPGATTHNLTPLILKKNPLLYNFDNCFNIHFDDNIAYLLRFNSKALRSPITSAIATSTVPLQTFEPSSLAINYFFKSVILDGTS
jgi:hypothetical protein